MINFFKKKEEIAPSQEEEVGVKKAEPVGNIAKERQVKWEENFDSYLEEVEAETDANFAETLRSWAKNMEELAPQNKFDAVKNLYKTRKAELDTLSPEERSIEIGKIMQKRFGEDFSKLPDENHRTLMEANNVLDTSKDKEQIERANTIVNKQIIKSYDALRQKKDPKLENQVASLKKMSDRLVAKTEELGDKMSIDNVA